MKKILFVLLFCVGMFAEVAYGAGGALNYYSMVLDQLGIHLESASQLEWLAVPGSILTLLVIWFLGVRYRRYVASFDTDSTPEGHWSLNFFVHGLIDYVHNLGRDLIGHEHRKYLALLVTIFVFVLLGNLAGMIPGVGSPTGFISGNLAIGLTVFAIYNWAGIKEHGVGYIKQFTGPFTTGIGLLLAVLFVVIELISHAARPASLAMRLLINVFADHMILDIFTDLTYVLVPAALAFFGLLVAFVQSFVFTLLSGIYISMAVSHDH